MYSSNLDMYLMSQRGFVMVAWRRARAHATLYGDIRCRAHRHSGYKVARTRNRLVELSALRNLAIPWPKSFCVGGKCAQSRSKGAMQSMQCGNNVVFTLSRPQRRRGRIPARSIGRFACSSPLKSCLVPLCGHRSRSTSPATYLKWMRKEISSFACK